MFHLQSNMESLCEELYAGIDGISSVDNRVLLVTALVYFEEEGSVTKGRGVFSYIKKYCVPSERLYDI